VVVVNGHRSLGAAKVLRWELSYRRGGGCAGGGEVQASLAADGRALRLRVDEQGQLLLPAEQPPGPSESSSDVELLDQEEEQRSLVALWQVAVALWSGQRLRPGEAYRPVSSVPRASTRARPRLQLLLRRKLPCARAQGRPEEGAPEAQVHAQAEPGCVLLELIFQNNQSKPDPTRLETQALVDALRVQMPELAEAEFEARGLSSERQAELISEAASLIPQRLILRDSMRLKLLPEGTAPQSTEAEALTDFESLEERTYEFRRLPAPEGP